MGPSSRSFDGVIQFTTTYSCPEEDTRCQAWQMSSFAITHESAVPTSASCLMRPKMAYVCTRHSMGSEDVHTLCCAEYPRMYVLGVPIKMSVYRTGNVECDRSLTPSTTHFKFNNPPCVHQGCSLTQQCITYRLPESSHRLVG